MNGSRGSRTSTTNLDFQPFKAWRYDPERVKISAVLAPPYDVISPAKQQKLYENSPFNSIRLILNKKDPADTDENNPYTRARDTFQDWQKQGVLIQEQESCFYVYRQTFKDPVTHSAKNRFALLGRVRLEPFEKGIIIPHEKTLHGPKEDRMKLLRTVRTNFSPVFGLYKDKGFEVRSMIQDPMNSEAIFEAEDDDKITHSLWAIKDPDILAKLHRALRSKKVYIADGHHRYETALTYARQQREEQRSSDTVLFPFDYMYVALVSFDDPGFIVLPTHRIVTQLGMTGGEAIRRLGEYFKVEKVSLAKLKEMTASYDQEGRIFGMVLEEGCFLLTMIDKEKAKERMVRGMSNSPLKDSKGNWASPGNLQSEKNGCQGKSNSPLKDSKGNWASPGNLQSEKNGCQGKPAIWYDLNVNVLAHLIFAELLGLKEDRWEAVLRFEHTVDGAVAPLQKGEAQAVFLLQPPKVEMLEKMGAVNERMPQKSTYFYPKLATGLVFYSHKE